MEQLRDNLERFGLNSRFFRGDETDMHLSSHSNAQQAYVETFNMGEFAVAWFDSSFRRSFNPVDLDDRLIETLGWSSLSGDLSEWILSALIGTDSEPTSPASESSDRQKTPDQLMIGEITRELDRYSTTGNVIHLHRLTALARDNGYNPLHYLDFRSGQHMLVLQGSRSDGLPFIICNYHPHSDRQVTIPSDPPAAVRSALLRFDFSHAASAIPAGETQ